MLGAHCRWEVADVSRQRTQAVTQYDSTTTVKNIQREDSIEPLMSLKSVTSRIVTRSQTRRGHIALVDERSVEQRRKLNEHLPVSQLPLEILLLIFSHIKAACYYYGTYDYGTVDSKRGDLGINDWVKVTHVCHLWRQTAIGASRLWTEIRICEDDCRWASEMLSRSGDSPLTAHVDFQTIDKRNSHHLAAATAILSLRKKLSNCRELTLRHDHHDSLEKLLQKSSTPQLQTLRIVSSPFGYRSATTVFSIGDSVFKGVESLLRLSVVYCHIDWDSQLLRNLTHLRLRDIPAKSRRSLDGLLAALSNIPKLEALDLHNAFISCSVTAGGRKTVLPSLKTLRLNAPMDEAAEFLSQVTFSSWITLHMYAFWEEPDDTLVAFRGLLQEISSHYPPAPPAQTTIPLVRNQIQALRIDFSCEHRVQGFCAALKQEEMNFTGLDPIIDLEFSWDALYYDAYEQVAPSLLGSLPIQQLITLQVIGRGLSDVSTEVWAQTFGTVPTLQSVFVSVDVASFTEGLMHGIDDTTDGGIGSASLPFPALSSVSFHNVAEDDPDDENNYPWAEWLRDTLLRSLEIRSKFGSNICDLKFFDCPSVTEANLVMLGQLVENVAESDLNFKLRDSSTKAVGETASLAEADEDECAQYGWQNI